VAPSGTVADPNNEPRFGPWRIVREIGRGGMGVVYLASRADQQFDRQVALKVLRGDFKADEVLSRFRHERQILAQLSHPNIATLLDGGSTPQGDPYIVMEYIEGEPLHRYCDAHNLSVRDRIRLFRQACSAVQYVHQHLIVHRDLKPGNFLVTADGTLKLLDFGIAKILQSDPFMTTMDVTMAGQVLMTPGYASPEQVRGQPVTTVSDVYSLGVLLYELLTGHGPYRVTSSALPELARAICETEPEKASTAIGQPGTDPLEISRRRSTDPERLRHVLKGDIDNILHKAMQKEPARRYSSAELFSEDLRCYLEDLPVTAHEDSLRYRAEKFVRRHKIPVAAAVVAAVSLVAGAGVALREARVATRQQALAERRFQDVRKLATTFLFDVHDSIQNLAGSTPARALIAKTGTEYLDKLASESHQDPSLQVEIAQGYLRIGDVEGNPFLSNLGNTAEAIKDYQKALDLAAAVVSANPKDAKARQTLVQANIGLASLLPFEGRQKEALEPANQAVRMATELAAAAPRDRDAQLLLSLAHEARADLLGGLQSLNLGLLDDAILDYEAALEAVPDEVPGGPLTVRVGRTRAVLGVKLADMQFRKRNIADALFRYQSALRMAEDVANASPDNWRSQDLVGAILNKIASTQIVLGDNNAALEAFRRAVEIDAAGLRADPNNSRARSATAVTQKNLGDLYYYNLHNMAEALNCYRRTADLLEVQAQADPSNVSCRQRLSEVLTYVASAMLATGQKEGARQAAQRGLAIARELADRTDATAAQVYNFAWLGITVDPADLRDARIVLPYALKAVQMYGGTDQSSLYNLAETYAALGDYAKALETGEKAAALFPPLQPGQPRPAEQETIEKSLRGYRDVLAKQNR
jgi:non-specific serine/threonine protein kinase/serine/threonine-protein kinase